MVAKAKLDDNPRDRQIRKSDRPLQTRLAQELHQNTNVPVGPCGIEQVKLFQAYLTEYQINIVSKEYNNNIIYAGPDKDKKIYLYMHNNHYDVITKMLGFFARVYYCHTCKKAYDHREEHVCPNECKCCGFSPICLEGSWRSCKNCHRQFKSQQCYDQHKRPIGNARSVCQTLIRCMKCMEVVDRRHLAPGKHLCGKRKCGTCGKYVHLEGHRCYIQPETKKKRKNPAPEEEEEIPNDGNGVSAFFHTECRQGEREEEEEEPIEESMKELLFFDLECRQENGNHEPNMCVVQNEAGEEWVFHGDKTIDEFCEWLFTTEHAGCTVMAHNFQGYDSYFILQYLRKQGVKYDVIMRGAKVLSLKVELFDIRFIDSLNFFPMKLASLPKTFGIEELKKGYFPHFFNKKDNENYVGPLPPATYYNPDGMNPKDKEAFMAWHATKIESNYVFNFHEEIIAYCRSDVDILRRCYMEFRELFYNITDIDPFRTLTIASACHLVYRTNYLLKDTIGIVPPMGYTPKNNQSLFAHKWLSYTAEKREIHIQHARNGGEKRVGDYFLDGYDEETHTAFEVHGCFWHGCPKCYARDTVNPVNNKTMRELHHCFVAKSEYLKRQGYNVVEVWECDVDRELKQNDEMKHYFDHFHMADPLNPRHALYGGRTNAAKLYHCCEGDEQIRYVDFTSLYPHINRSKTVPTYQPSAGHYREF